MNSRPTTASAVTIVLAAIALLVFGRLAFRHVGESYFLADQVDQLQKYEAALRLEPEGLWGPAMSGTAARALGPFGALTFGTPLALGLGIDAIHGLTTLLLVLATGVAFWQLAQLNSILAWGWLMVFTAMRMVWWNAAMFWVNTLLLPLGLVLLALFTAHVRRPSVTTIGAMALTLLLALHVHLAALVGLPILMIAAGRWWHATRSQPLTGQRMGPSTIAVTAGLALVLLPYAYAETATNLRNTRAMFSHVENASQSAGGEGARAALETIALAADPMALLQGNVTLAIAVASSVALTASLLLVVRRRQARSDAGRQTAGAMLSLVVSAIVGVVVQALFFLLMARPLNGLHYAILLAPWYAIVPAALLAALLPESSARTTIGTVVPGLLAVVLLVVRGPALADRFAERTPWNFTAIVDGLDTLCDGDAVQTREGAGLVNELTPGYDSVLVYVMTRGFSRCRFDASSHIVIAADRNPSFDEMITIGGDEYVRERVVPPGLARYRRAP